MNPPIPPPQTTTNDNINAPTTITKRKRTKRQRPTSLFPSHSSTSNNPINSSSPSFSNSPATPEDQDTANCLILLSKGHKLSPCSNSNSNNNSNMRHLSGYKFNSKRYIQTSTDTTTTTGLAGVYVYECKTCNRTFSSFQALGGHRASHKKPKVNELDKQSPATAFSDEGDHSPEILQFLELNHHRNYSPGNVKKQSSSKLHECSICGAEFNSGQALGGHMRRHRAVNGNGNVTGVSGINRTVDLIRYGGVTVARDCDDRKLGNGGLCLALDLNLPAPPETAVTVADQGQRRELGFKLTANEKKQQQLSAGPTLVDCYY
ncbi:hypothetical protein QVD17_36168 [Tagetes erecta]|uniref:C2H2-type domain-containing protein n=1 Tax=Tagetes erecta TaxID=13708 RepID=A0AAD8NH56_TARER|nr:hypothetical protein QVD17_36168 [Tagetes erecta]